MIEKCKLEAFKITFFPMFKVIGYITGGFLILYNLPLIIELLFDILREMQRFGREHQETLFIISGILLIGFLAFFAIMEFKDNLEKCRKERKEKGGE